MTELFQFVNGTFVPTNLSVSAKVPDQRPTRDGRSTPNCGGRGSHLAENGQTSRDAQNLFDGSTYSPRLDEARLTGQLQRVRDLMSDSVWRTLSDISKALGDPESSVSARLRDLRKARFGMFTVERRRKNLGTWEYRLR